MTSDTAQKLSQLGFSIYEAKTYLALLHCQPASAYEIAKQAGIPTSKIYETVSKLVTKGVLQANQEGPEGKQYFAMDPADLMASIRVQTINDTVQLQAELARLPGQNESNLIWPLLDLQQVQNKFTDLINQSKTSILVSIWPEELIWCKDSLEKAQERGLKIALVHFGKPTLSIGATYHHPAEKTLYQEKGGRGLTLVCDGQEVAIANFTQQGAVDGAWSRNQTFVTVAEDYIKHDVYITKVTRFLHSQVTDRFGDDYALLRDVFNADA